MKMTAQARLRDLVEARCNLKAAQFRLEEATIDLKASDEWAERQHASKQVKMATKDLEEMLDQTVSLVQQRLLLDVEDAGEMMRVVDQETGEVVGTVGQKQDAPEGSVTFTSFQPGGQVARSVTMTPAMADAAVKTIERDLRDASA